MTVWALMPTALWLVLRVRHPSLEEATLVQQQQVSAPNLPKTNRCIGFLFFFFLSYFYLFFFFLFFFFFFHRPYLSICLAAPQSLFHGLSINPST